MKRNYRYLLILGFSATIFASCHREYLDPKPQTSITDESAFNTAARVQNQVLSLYAALKNGSFYGGRYIVYGDIRGRNFINETGNLITNSDVWALNPANSATAVVNLWQAAYQTINVCNVFLKGMDVKGTSVVGDSLSKNYIGEAKFVRALSYYSLLQFYARPYADGNGSKPGVPLRLTAITGSGSSPLARATVAEVYAQIIKDLDSAETLLPSVYANAYTNTTHAHRNSAIALKTRVYLSMGNYAKVISEANKIVSTSAPFKAATGVANALQADITNVFKTPYTTTESIMSMPFTTTSPDYPGTQNQLGYYFYNNSKVGTAEFSLNASGIIADAGWTSTDKRRSFIYLNTSTNKSYLSKYPGASPYTDYAPVIRYSEVLLNLAEALARTNTGGIDSRAVDLLNAVRGRSDATTVFTPGGFASYTDLTSAILKEREIEFLGEGLNNNDLMRLLATIPGKASSTTIVDPKTPTQAGYIWPISSTELALNTLCVDN